MARVIPNIFTSYVLTPDELKSGQSLSLVQIRVMQNLMSEAAQERVNLIYDPLNPLLFVQRDAELKGQIGILTYLINYSNEINEINEINN